MTLKRPNNYAQFYSLLKFAIFRFKIQRVCVHVYVCASVHVFVCAHV